MKFTKNREYLSSIPKLTYDLHKQSNADIKHLIEQMKLGVTIQDLKDFEFGSYFDDTIFNIYVKLMKLFS
jgi:Ulp1 family protease